MNNDSNNDMSIKVDEDKVAKLVRKIIVSESKNIKSGEKSETQMVKEIKKMIEEEIKCY